MRKFPSQEAEKKKRNTKGEAFDLSNCDATLKIITERTGKTALRIADVMRITGQSYYTVKRILSGIQPIRNCKTLYDAVSVAKALTGGCKI
jgi:hypothetical protein